MGNSCKYIITFLLILSFLCQNFSWAYGGDKLAPSSKVDDSKLRAAAAAYAEMIEERNKPEDPDDDTPPSGGVLRCIIVIILIPFLIFVWLSSPINANTAFANPSPPAVQADVPEWIPVLEEMIRLEQLSQQPRRYGVGLQYDSLGGGYVSGNADFGSGLWGVGGLAGFGNPLLGSGEEGLGGIGTAYWKPGDNLWLSLRGGLLPDHSLDSTYFVLAGIDTDLLYVFHPYLHAGMLNRRLDGVPGQATGLLLDTGINARRGWFEGGLSASGPLYFRPTAGTREDSGRVVGDLSLLRARLGYDDGLWWVRGVADVGGTESRLNDRLHELPSNRFSGFGVDAGLRFDLGKFNTVLNGNVQQVNPSFAGRGRLVAGSSISLRWRDLSLRGGFLYGPFVRPYAEVLYRVMSGVDVSAGYNVLPPLYTGDFYDSPWGPRRNLLTFGLTGNLGATARPQVYPRDEYPVQSPTGTAMDGFVYGPFKPSAQEGVDDRSKEARARFERLLRSAVRDAKTVNEVYAIFKKLQELIDPDFSYTLLVFNTYWIAFYDNPNLDFYWIYFIKEKINPDHEYKYWHEIYKYSYKDILDRLLNKRYKVDDYTSAQALISEFDQLMSTIEDAGADKEILDNIDSLFKFYSSILDKTKPGSPEFIFAYYVASRLFYILGRHDIYPGTEALTRLADAYFMIPLDSVGLDAGMLISNKKIIDGLRLQYMYWIIQEDPETQIQGILALELLSLETGGAIEIKDDLIVRLYDIFRKVLPSPETPYAPEPLIPLTTDDENYLRIKAAALALDVLVRIDKPVSKEELERFRIVYNILPPYLQQRLLTDDLRRLLEKKPEGKGAIRPLSGVMKAFLLPLIAGLFLSGCSGTGIGAAAGIGMLLVLAATVSMAGANAATAPEEKRRTYKPTGNKAVDDFMGAIGDRKTILALDTDIGNLRDPAMPLLATLERLSHNGMLGGITFIRASGSRLRDKIEKAVGKDEDVNIVLVCKDSNKKIFDGLRNVFITGVDDSERAGTYIPILEILTLSLKMASRADINEVRGLYKEITGEELTEDVYAGKSLLLILPRSEPVDYESLKEIYESQKDLLLSA